MVDRIEIRCVEVRGNVYIRREDVANLIREVAGSEETDVRNRLEELARRLEQING